MDLRDVCPEKLLTPEKSVKKIKNGSRVFIGTGCGEPQRLIKAMVENQSAQDIIVYQMLSSSLSKYIHDKKFLSRFSIKLFFISVLMRQSAFEGKIDYIPVYLSQIPKIFEHREIGLDVALIQVCPPDKHGYCSLGISVDITLSGMKTRTWSSPRSTLRCPGPGGIPWCTSMKSIFWWNMRNPYWSLCPARKTRKSLNASAITSTCWWMTAPPCRSASDICRMRSCLFFPTRKSGNPHPGHHRRTFASV